MDPTRTSEVPEIIHKLFKGLQMTYPTFCKGFDKKHTDGIKRLWAKKLASFSDDRILHALWEVSDHYPHKPVLIGEFRKLCTRPTQDAPRPLRLEAMKSTKVVAKEAMDEIAKLLPEIRTDYKPLDESTEQARRQELANQAEQLMDQK